MSSFSPCCAFRSRSSPGVGWLGLAILTVLLAGQAAMAGSITASSVWNRQNALERARQQMPLGATVTRERCEEVGVGMGNYRYRCTVWFSPPGEPAAPADATPAVP